MLYIPMFKGRKYEQDMMRRTNGYFSCEMIPLIEIFHDHYQKNDFAKDPITGEYLKRTAGTKQRKYRVPPTDADIDTLQYYSECVAGRMAFIDYFRFSTSTYGKKLDIQAISLSLILNQNEELYIKRLLEIGYYDNLIPVISIKQEYFPRAYKIGELVVELHKKSERIAVRLDDAAFEKYGEIIAPLLKAGDFIMYDIREQNVASKALELEEFAVMATGAKKIVLNSPRKKGIQNGEYEHRCYTNLIDNSARDIKNMYPTIDGFGDYCGLKDSLPASIKTRYGAALTLLYQYSNNRFMVYVNKETEEGFRGYSQLIPQILEDLLIIDPDRNCPAIQEIIELNRRGSTGNWQSWNKINMLRYLCQMHKHLDS